MHSAVKIANKFVIMSDESSLNDDPRLKMTQLKLMKLTYVAHGWMLGLFDRPLISEDVEAWQLGPVIPELYRETQKFGKNPVTEFDKAYYSVELDDDENSIVQQVHEIYSTELSGSQLVTITHKEGTPWYQVTNGGRDKYSRSIIPNTLIGSYYKELSKHG